MDPYLTLIFLSPSYFICKLLREFKEIGYVKYLSLEQSTCSVNTFVSVHTYADCLARADGSWDIRYFGLLDLVEGEKDCGIEFAQK